VRMGLRTCGGSDRGGRRGIGGVLLLVGLFGGRAAPAGGVDRGVTASLLHEAGWSGAQALDGGLVVDQKPVPGVGLVAFRGRLPLGPDTDYDRLWSLLSDVGNHERVGGRLAESEVFRREGARIEFYQVLKPPPLLGSAQRYWFSHTELEQAVGGDPSHRRRCWSGLPAGEATALRAQVQARYPSASEVALTHGCWELRGAAGSPGELRYVTVSDPGGQVPASLAALLTARTLPENMRAFVAASRPAGG